MYVKYNGEVLKAQKVEVAEELKRLQDMKKTLEDRIAELTAVANAP